MHECWEWICYDSPSTHVQLRFPVPGALCFICQCCSLQNLLVNRIQFMHSINHGTSPPLQVPLAAFAGTPEATSHPICRYTLLLFFLQWFKSRPMQWYQPLKNWFISPTELQNPIQFPSIAISMRSFQSFDGISWDFLKYAYWDHGIAGWHTAPNGGSHCPNDEQ